MLVKIKRERIDTVAFASCFAWSIREDMPKVSAASMTSDFRPNHAVRRVFVKINTARQCLVKARPAATGIVFGIGAKKLRAAVCADVHTIIGDIEQLASKRSFGCFVEKHCFLLIAEIWIDLLHTTSIRLGSRHVLAQRVG